MIEALIISSLVTNLDVVNNTMSKFGYSQHSVDVRAVDETHFMLKRPGKDRQAVALRTRDGSEIILVSKNIDPQDRVSLIQHEVSHIVVWRINGIKIKEHGKKFKKICRQAVEYRTNYFCK